jgi:hypothetical protein
MLSLISSQAVTSLQGAFVLPLLIGTLMLMGPVIMVLVGLIDDTLPAPYDCATEHSKTAK